MKSIPQMPLKRHTIVDSKNHATKNLIQSRIVPQNSNAGTQGMPPLLLRFMPLITTNQSIAYMNAIWSTTTTTRPSGYNNWIQRVCKTDTDRCLETKWKGVTINGTPISSTRLHWYQLESQGTQINSSWPSLRGGGVRGIPAWTGFPFESRIKQDWCLWL